MKIDLEGSLHTQMAFIGSYAYFISLASTFRMDVGCPTLADDRFLASRTKSYSCALSQFTLHVHLIECQFNQSELPMLFVVTFY